MKKVKKRCYSTEHGELMLGPTEVSWDIDLPTNEEVKELLEESFTADQADKIVSSVYSPLRELLKNSALRGVK